MYDLCESAQDGSVLLWSNYKPSPTSAKYKSTKYCRRPPSPNLLHKEIHAQLINATDRGLLYSSQFLCMHTEPTNHPPGGGGRRASAS